MCSFEPHLFHHERGLDLGYILVDVLLQRCNVNRLPYWSSHSCSWRSSKRNSEFLYIVADGLGDGVG